MERSEDFMKNYGFIAAAAAGLLLAAPAQAGDAAAGAKEPNQKD